MNVPADSRVAVIGMAFRFPGADTPEEFWHVIRDGLDCVRRFTDEELAAAGVPAEKYRADDFVGASGILSGIDRFDAGFFGMSVREAQLTTRSTGCSWNAPTTPWRTRDTRANGAACAPASSPAPATTSTPWRTTC